MTGDCHVQFWESARVRFPRATQLDENPNDLPPHEQRTAFLFFPCILWMTIIEKVYNGGEIE